MYIRIQDFIIRFRLSRIEAERALAGENFSACLNLSPEYQINYSVECCDSKSQFTFSDQHQQMQLRVNREQLSAEIQQRPSKTGIQIEYADEHDARLQIFLEVDLKKRSKPE